MEKKTIYLDYVGGGFYALSFDKEFSFPRINVCACPVRLFQECCKQFDVVCSDAVAMLLDNDMMGLSYIKQYFKYEKYRTEEIQPE